MEKVDLSGLKKILQGLLDGTIDVRLKKGTKKPKGKVGRPPKKTTKLSKKKMKKKVAAKTRKYTRKVGRKPFSALAKQKAIAKIKRNLIREAKRNLPTSREVFEFLHGKHDGAKLSVISRHFNSPRNVFKPFISKLVANGDLTNDRGVFYLKRRIRNLGPSVVEKLPPVKPEVVIHYLQANPGVTLAEMTSGLGLNSYQRLIKVVNHLKKTQKVLLEDKKYRLA